jgi:hypothetical protein
MPIYDHLVYFVVIWYIYKYFPILDFCVMKKSGNPASNDPNKRFRNSMRNVAGSNVSLSIEICFGGSVLSGRKLFFFSKPVLLFDFYVCQLNILFVPKIVQYSIKYLLIHKRDIECQCIVTIVTFA